MWPHSSVPLFRMPFMNSSYQFLMSFCSWLFFLGLPLQAGSFQLLSDLFSIRPSSTAAVRGITLHTVFENKIKLCKGLKPNWANHGVGIAGHMMVSTAISKLIQHMVEEEMESVKKLHLQKFITANVYEMYMNHAIMRHFADMSAMELHACEYLASRVHLLIQQAGNLTVENNTIQLQGARPPVWVDFRIFERYYRASIFSACSGSLVLYIVILRRTRLGLAFTFPRPSMTLRALVSTSPSSSLSTRSSPSSRTPVTSVVTRGLTTNIHFKST